MKIILAPAKKMKRADDDFAWRSLPVFLNKTEILLEKMRSMESAELKKMWKCSDQIVRQNEERLRTMDLENRLSPAVFTYVGLAYQHMAPGAMTEKQLEYLQEHLRILSGFYGVLKPFDGVAPYRLEMQAAVPGLGDLYSFWGDALYKEVRDEDGVIVSLASKEYSSAIEKYLGENDRMVTVVFGERKNGKIIQKGTMAKMARGEMTWWMAENDVRDPLELKEFDAGWRFSEEDSSEEEFVFIAAEKE
jgi:cytoplasmic iron level regulating protein YaaA (DUF328/UPF0246 family)